MAARQAIRAAALILAFGAGPALAQPVTAEDPDRIAALMEAAGFPAEIVTTAYGDPAILSEAAGDIPFELRFFGCDRGRQCLSVQLRAGFPAGGLTAEEVNVWNGAMRYGRAHLGAPGEVFLSYDINLEAGGVPEANFAAQLAMWQMLLDRFAARLGL